MKVFVSYAREDVDAARKLAASLASRGIDVWFDENSLLPGMNWWAEIRRAIDDSRFFIVLLSERSVSKRGVIQKEIRRALDVLDEYPEGTIYLLPVRLDDCRVSYSRLHGIHWINMFPDWESGVLAILRALGHPAPVSPSPSESQRILRLADWLEDEKLQNRAADELRSFGPRAIALLLDRFKTEPNSDVYSKLLVVIRDIGHNHAAVILPAVFEVFCRIEDRHKRAMLGIALREWGAISVPYLIQALRHGEQVGLVAAGALDDETLYAASMPALLGLLDDRQTRHYASTLLVYMGPRSIPGLLSALDDPFKADIAVVALKELGEPGLRAILPCAADETKRYWVEQCITMAGQPALALVDAALESDPGAPWATALADILRKVRASLIERG